MESRVNELESRLFELRQYVRDLLEIYGKSVTGLGVGARMMGADTKKGVIEEYFPKYVLVRFDGDAIATRVAYEDIYEP